MFEVSINDIDSMIMTLQGMKRNFVEGHLDSVANWSNHLEMQVSNFKLKLDYEMNESLTKAAK